jgi:tRNA pseudouridine38-40 synthase
VDCRTRKYKLTIAYDGRAYQGWQTQKIGTGVQQKVEAALARIFPSKPILQGSSRTDTGVHALALVAHFEAPAAECRTPPRRLVLALNAWLPEDIRVMRASPAAASFHARFDASGKEYRYYIWNEAAMNPLLRHMAWHVPRKLDAQAMRLAAKHFIGNHDFRSFTANPGYARESTVRRLTACEVRRKGPLLTVIIRGDGFLYKMCRGIVGTLVQTGLGRFSAEAIQEMLQQRDRSAAGMSAPAHGLVLHRVFYPKRKAAPSIPAAAPGRS